MTTHPSWFTQPALLYPRREDDLPDHAWTGTVAAIATAGQTRWSIEDTRNLGLAGLLFNLGTLMVPAHISSGSTSLADLDRSRLMHHPMVTLCLLRDLDGPVPIVCLAALQHHQRENASG